MRRCCWLPGIFALLWFAGTCSTFAQTNTNCASAILLTNQTIYSVDTSNVSSSNNPTTLCGYNVGREVWFTVVPTNNQRVNISTCNSGFATLLSVYTNTCGALSNVLDYANNPVCSSGSNPFGCGSGQWAGVSFSGVANTTYYVLVEVIKMPGACLISWPMFLLRQMI